jgi:uncharacterized membrane protein
VQSIDQIEDLLSRIGRCELNKDYAKDARGYLRVVVPMPTWEDYLRLAFDEIRVCGGEQVQVMRRMRSALNSLADSVATVQRAGAVRRYLAELDRGIEHSTLDSEDQSVARQEDRQGIGLSRRPLESAGTAGSALQR